MDSGNTFCLRAAHGVGLARIANEAIHHVARRSIALSRQSHCLAQFAVMAPVLCRHLRRLRSSMTPIPTIRLFVSSTFKDLKAERDALQVAVFDRLRRLCQARGVRFQAIDLRWGISREAGLDNRTIRICLRELRRCQQDRLKPNFLVLLADRYGWRPLPEVIPAALFRRIAARMAEVAGSTAGLFESVYQIDENSLPPVAELKSKGTIPDWEKNVGTPVLSALEATVASMPTEQGLTELGIGLSATHQEILHGALQLPQGEARAHVHAFVRSVRNLSGTALPREFSEEEADAVTSQDRLAALKHQLADHLGPENYHSFTLDWVNGGADGKGKFTSESLNAFCENVYSALERVVESQLSGLQAISADDKEYQAHQAFGSDRCRRFEGRRDALERIMAYLRSGDAGPLAVLGSSGSGKSALMARSAELITLSAATTVTRYLGATPASTDLMQLLRGLVGEIRRHYPASDDGALPIELPALVDEFRQALQRPDAARPLCLLLDALDQLGPSYRAHSLDWLPLKLKPSVRVVVSAALPDDTAERNPVDPRVAVLDALRSRVPEAQRITLGPLTAEDGERALANWLAEAHRTLQPTQRRAVLETFQREGNPLWLRIAAEEAARLRDGDPAPAFAATTTGLMGQVLRRLSREDEHGTVLVSRTLGYLACARHGLAEDEIIALLSKDEEVMKDFWRRSPRSEQVRALPVAVWVRLHGDLSFYLAERQAQDASLLGFYHRHLAEAAQQEFFRSAADVLAVHARIAAYFRASADPAGDATWLEGSRRALEELPHHLTSAAAPAELEAVVGDVEFTTAACQAGLPFAWLRDVDTALGRWALPLAHQMRKAVASSFRTILEQPRFIRSALYNRLVWAGPVGPELTPSLARARARLDAAGPWFETVSPFRDFEGLVFPAERPHQSFVAWAGVLATADHEGRLEVRGLRRGELLATRALSSTNLRGLAVEPLELQAAWIEADGTVRVENAATTLRGRSGESLLAFPAADSVIAMRHDDALVAWNPQTGSEAILAAALPSPLVAMHATITGDRVVWVAGTGRQAKVQRIGVAWRHANTWHASEWPGVDAVVTHACLTPDGTSAILVGANRHLYVVEGATGTMIAKPMPYERRHDVTLWGKVETCGCGQGPEGTWLYIATDKGHVCRWDWRTDRMEAFDDFKSLQETTSAVLLKCTHGTDEAFLTTPNRLTFVRRDVRAQVHHAAAVTACVITASGRVASICRDERSLRWWTFDGLRPLHQFTVERPSAMALCADADAVYIGTEQGWLLRCPFGQTPANGQAVPLFDRMVAQVVTAGPGVALAASADGTVKRVTFARESVEWLSPTGMARRQLGLFLHPDPARKYVTVRQSEVANMQTIIALGGTDRNEDEVFRSDYLIHVAVSSDTHLVATAGRALDIFSLEGRTLRRLFGHAADYRVAGIDFMSDNRSMIVARLRDAWIEWRGCEEGAPLLAALELPSRPSCLHLRDRQAVVGLQSGEILCLRLHA